MLLRIVSVVNLFFRHPGSIICAGAKLLCMLALVQLSTAVATCSAQREVTCQQDPLAFRSDIRSPDAWEMAWEARWPEASMALQTWRNEQFDLLLEMWRHAGAVLPDLRRKARNAGLPESAAFLVWWSELSDPFDPGLSTHRIGGIDVELMDALPEEAMVWGHAQSGTSLPLNQWASAVRTGMRLMENFEMPEIHIVSEGETVYSIARSWNISPHCLSAKNDVWDEIRPGMTLLIPHALN